MENEMAVVPEVRYDLSVARDPKQVLAEAMNAAKALQTVIKQKSKPVKFNGEQYIEFEDWQVLGRFYGVTAKIVSTEFVEIGGVKGFVARAEALDRDGRVVSAAEAMCLNDEEKWSTRAKYEYQNGERVKVGEVSVPLFQLRSMAQTRAAAKSLRNVLAWVVVMAGFRPNVAEEMTGDEHAPSKEPIKPATPKSEDPYTLTFVPVEVQESQSKTDADKTWVKWGVKLPDGKWAGTFNEEFGTLLVRARDEKKAVKLTWGPDGKYRAIKTLELA